MTTSNTNSTPQNTPALPQDMPVVALLSLPGFTSSERACLIDATMDHICEAASPQLTTESAAALDAHVEAGWQNNPSQGIGALLGALTPADTGTLAQRTSDLVDHVSTNSANAARTALRFEAHADSSNNQHPQHDVNVPRRIKRFGGWAIAAALAFAALPLFTQNAQVAPAPGTTPAITAGPSTPIRVPVAAPVDPDEPAYIRAMLQDAQGNQIPALLQLTPAQAEQLRALQQLNTK